MRLNKEMNWEATDGDGGVYQYENEPRPAEAGGDWWFHRGGGWAKIRKASPPADWRTTKRYIGNEPIMTEIQDLRPAVLQFAQEMELALRQQDGQGGWRADYPTALRGWVFSQEENMKRAWANDLMTASREMVELVELANRCMMLWDVLQRYGKKER